MHFTENLPASFNRNTECILTMEKSVFSRFLQYHNMPFCLIWGTYYIEGQESQMWSTKGSSHYQLVWEMIVVPENLPCPTNLDPTPKGTKKDTVLVILCWLPPFCSCNYFAFLYNVLVVRHMASGTWDSLDRLNSDLAPTVLYYKEI
jgi:hypothetical protein